jgi:hypothetical protein
VAFAAEATDSQQIAQLLSQAKTQAFQIKEDATTMESFNRIPVSREAQAAMINEVRDHVNALGRTEVKLKDAEALGSGWQKQAIDRVVPFLDELNGYTSAVIEHLNGEVPHTLAEYKDYLEANADYSTDLAKMIADFVDYGKTKDRLERLNTKLEISAR